MAYATARFSVNIFFCWGYNQNSGVPMTLVEIRIATLLMCILKIFDDKINSNTCNPVTTAGNTTVIPIFANAINPYLAGQNFVEI